MAEKSDKNSHLNQGRLNIGLLCDSYCKEFLALLDNTGKRKVLIWDKALTKPFGFIIDFPELKKHGVETMFQIEENGTISNCPLESDSIIFVMKPQLEYMNYIVDYISKTKSRGGAKKDFYIIFTPRKTVVCEQRLEELNALRHISFMEEFGLDLLPLDNDLLSMEDPECHAAYTLGRGDSLSALHRLSKGLLALQSLYGTIPNIYGKGHAAKQVCDNLRRMNRESGTAGMPPIVPQIDNLVLLDRNVDPLTPLLTQLTYEGLVDELLGISNGRVKYSVAGEDGKPGVEKTALLNSGDELFAELRDRNFDDIGALISNSMKLLNTQYKEKDNLTSVSQIKDFVTKMPYMEKAKKSLSFQIDLSEKVKEIVEKDDFMDKWNCERGFVNGRDTDTADPYIERRLANADEEDLLSDLVRVLRLMCIQSFCNDGLKPRLLEFYRREIIQVYGHRHLLSLLCLEKAGLLTAQGVPANAGAGEQMNLRNYAKLRKTLGLTDDQRTRTSPDPLLEMNSGYAPLSIRLVQRLGQDFWRSITELLRTLPGPEIKEKQDFRGVGSGDRATSSPTASGGTSTVGERKLTLVVFIGGVTYSEVSALRALSQMEDSESEYIVVTTKMINGANWLRSLLDPLSLVEKQTPINPFA